MSDLTFFEKQKFEKLLGMGSGYVLEFSNRTFTEFVADSTGRNIFDSRYDYASGSKANRLRAFWLKESNAVVGKLMSDLLDMIEADGPAKDACRLIVGRLLGKNPVPTEKPIVEIKEQPSAHLIRSKELAQLRETFHHLAIDSDRNKAGLALEQLLNRLFTIYQLQPRLPFRVIGEQIDGSFELDGEIYLLESKWEKHPLPEADLLVFRGKIEGKSAFTRGVFLALNDIALPARDAITRGKSPLFFVVNGYDLMMILSEAITLTDFLRKRFRLLAEEGRVCVPFSELA
jgi:hypothetical protein